MLMTAPRTMSIAITATAVRRECVNAKTASAAMNAMSAVRVALATMPAISSRLTTA